jgi:lipoyl-dependent peroxiredoxin
VKEFKLLTERSNMKSNATATWQGKGIDGTGSITTKSNILHDVPYSYKTRFKGRDIGTSPEELIAAAHASCFAMKLAFVLESEGFVAKELRASCEITLDAGVITTAHLVLKAIVPGLAKSAFDELVANSGQNCPVSKLMKASVTIDAELLP